jgi:REP element-mobilizing transposase RayT
MPRRGDVFLERNFYHIYNRGRSGEIIFHNEANYEYCLKLIKRNLHRYNVGMIAYCLMPNHYHFLLRQNSTIPLTKFISSIFISYVQALNKQLKSSGPLFEGRYKHVLVDKEEYIVHLCRYIHMNPIQAGIVSRPEDWPYSNYLEWINLRDGSLKDEDFINERFQDKCEYQAFVNDLQIEEDSRKLISKYIMD